MPVVAPSGLLDGRCREGLPDALDPDARPRSASGSGPWGRACDAACSRSRRRGPCGSGRRTRWCRVTPSPFVSTWTQSARSHGPVAVEVDAASPRLPAVGEPVAVRVDDVPGRIETRRPWELRRGRRREPRAPQRAGRRHRALNTTEFEGRPQVKAGNSRATTPLPLAPRRDHSASVNRSFPVRILVERHRVAREVAEAGGDCERGVNPVAVSVP